MDEYIVKYNGDLSTFGIQVELLNENYAIVKLSEQDVDKIITFPNIEYIEKSKGLFLSVKKGNDYSKITIVQQQNKWGLKGTGVIIGIIDSGIDINHTEFQGEDGKTRILYLWDMLSEGKPPSGFKNGTEYTKVDIDNNTIENNDFLGHGTAVAAIAAGKSGAAPNASIIAVKLGETDSRTADLMRGVKYIIDKAQQLNMPCVINLSYGTNHGSHKGDSLFETYIDQMARRWKTVIVCASGNEGYCGHHFSGQLNEKFCMRVPFSVSLNVRELYMSLWKNFADTVTYELLLPDGTSTGEIIPSDRIIRRYQSGIIISAHYAEPNHYRKSQEVLFKIEEQDGVAEGIWTLLCCGTQIANGDFDIWLPTIEEVGTKTTFLTSEVNNSITLPATASSPISVGGYCAERDNISSFSGRGTLYGRTIDLIAPAENIYSAKSGGGYDVFSGTSMAAPFVSGASALLMEWGIVKQEDPFLYGERIKAFLCRGATRMENRSYPHPSLGYGKLNVYQTMNELMHYIRR